ncbi:MAG: hypothetical protein IPN68_18775 [Bacteroidetes bacterium]|nr:hypothetical protein [Bacteroidota bacterium]
MAEELVEEVKYKVAGQEGVKDRSETDFQSTWDKNMLSDEVKLELGFFKSVNNDHLSRSYNLYADKR